MEPVAKDWGGAYSQWRLLRRPLTWLVGSFLAVWAGHYVLRRFVATDWDTPLEGFPVSVMAPNLALSGLPWLAGYLLLAWWAVRHVESLTAWRLWLVTLALLLLGNLGQGSFSAGFLAPLIAGEMQYATDAARIQDWRLWLADFNAEQAGLGEHARYHPPFAVLLVYLLLEGFGDSGAALAILGLASLVPPLLLTTLRFWTTESAARRCALTMALLPAFGIYGAVSLDAVILLFATSMLWGLAAWRSGRGSLPAGAALSLGLLAMSLLTFLSLLPLAAAGLFALSRRDGGLLIVLTLAAVLAAAALALMQPLAGYDHWQAFRTAEALHNPDGWWFLSRPGAYLATRIECLMENLLFLSFPLAAVWLAARPWRARRESGPAATLSMGAVYLLFLLTGGAHTGETARTLLFLYPWLIAGLSSAEPSGPGATGPCRRVLLAIALQTAAMQFIGDYFW